ncbi:MAG: benzoate-CoA ligase family protein [Actinomycetota bacterium]|nr:benzoate-CoA ligase family protein [Actinomycetota bacterium]
MQRVELNGVEFEYETKGQGAPVLLIHGSHIGGSFVPLLNQPALVDDYLVIRYHRRGFGNSSPARGGLSVAQQADDARALLEYLEVGPTHVVGHSYGGLIGLQMAADFPDSLQTLSLLEAALLTVPGGEQVRRLVAVAGELYRKGDWDAAEDLFLGSPQERADIARGVPGGLEQALRDVDTYFVTEAPAHDDWEFGAAEAHRIRCPTLFVNGSESSQLYREARDEVKRWLPETETVTLSGASHLLQIQQPEGAAELLAEFFAANPRARPDEHGRPSRLPHRPAGRSGRHYNATIDILEANLERGRAEAVALTGPAGDWTYQDVVTGANRAGNALRELGVDVENRILMAVEDSPEFATTFFGAIKLGAVPVPVNTNLRPDDYVDLLNDSRAKVAVVSEAVARTLRETRSQALHLRGLVVVGEAADDELSFATITSAAEQYLQPADTTRDDVCFWLYTSGTGGPPKAVVHLQHAMRACVDTYATSVLAINDSDVTYSVSKLYFAYGLGGGLYFPLAAGGTALLVSEPPQPRTVLHMVERFRPTILFGVPTSYSSILNSSREPSMAEHFDSVRMCVSAGEPLAASLLTRWKEWSGCDIVEGIGSTESCHIYISNRPEDISPGCTGTEVEGYQARIVDDEGRDVPAGQVGTLLVKGDSMFAHYWRDRELSRRKLLGEWLDTGDMYRRDEAGGFYFQGRLDDMLKVAGMWVSPIEVEAALMNYDAVMECAVVGMHDAINLVQLVAFVVTQGDEDPGELQSALTRHVRQRLGGNKTPRAFRFVEALPRTAAGKLHRAKLREQAAELVMEG